jgi:hypothetical protein
MGAMSSQHGEQIADSRSGDGEERECSQPVDERVIEQAREGDPTQPTGQAG